MSYLFLFGKHRRNPLTGRGEVLKSSYSDCKYQIIVKKEEVQNMSCIAYFILLTILALGFRVLRAVGDVVKCYSVYILFTRYC